jgi:carbamoyl-phosphate synthase large subunit
MKDLRVIVTACGAPGGPGIIKSLRQVTERSIWIIGVDANPMASGLFLADEAHIVPDAAGDTYVQAMAQLARHSRADAILPLSGTELLPLSRNLDRFPGTRVVVNRTSALEIALDKQRSYAFLASSAVAIPSHRAVHDFDEFVAAVHELGYPQVPVCFKPSVSKGGRGFRVLREDLDLRRILLETKADSSVTTLGAVSPILVEGFAQELLVSEYLPGTEYSVDSLVRNGVSLVTVPRRRSETKMGISSVGIVERNDEVMRAAEEINRALGFDYNINVQLKYGADGVPKLVEINPRVSGTICLSVEAGPNLPYLAIKQALGEEVAIPEVQWGVTMIRYWSELYVRDTPARRASGSSRGSGSKRGLPSSVRD